MPKSDFYTSRTNLPYLNLNGPLHLAGNGLCTIMLRPTLEQASITGAGKPTIVHRGAVAGYGLPLYALDEELFLRSTIPRRWDGVSDIDCDIHCYLASTQTGDNAFRLQIGWQRNRTSINEVVLNTVQLLEVETNTGVEAAEFTSYQVKFSGVNAIPYNYADHELLPDDDLSIRIRRVDEEGAKVECTGDIVIMNIGLIFVRNKLGAPL